MQHALLDQGGHRAIDRRQVGGRFAGRQAVPQPLVDLRDGQMAVDRLEHRQHRDPRRHPP